MAETMPTCPMRFTFGLLPVKIKISPTLASANLMGVPALANSGEERGTLKPKLLNT
ncbi:hypothetical protein D9M68_627910 [compost metagenome]